MSVLGLSIKMQFYKFWVARFKHFFVTMGVSSKVLGCKANIEEIKHEFHNASLFCMAAVFAGFDT